MDYDNNNYTNNQERELQLREYYSAITRNEKKKTNYW